MEKKGMNNIELAEEEVNMYNVNCGKIQLACTTDCIMVTCFLTCDQ